VSSKLTLLRECVSISGEHYIVSNGFITKAHGEVQIRYKDLLAVEFAKYRSKKVMYVMLFLGGILIFATGFDDFLPMAMLAVLAVVVGIFMLLYLFSVRKFVEITSMKGTYRIAAERNDTEMESIVATLRGRVS
jgi:hypothetical protein